MFWPQLLAIFWELSLACAAYVWTNMLEIPYMIKIIVYVE